MKKDSTNDSLDAAIALLETKRDLELMQLQEHLHVVHERLKPGNLITETFKSVTASPDLKNGIGKAIIGIASGFLVRKILFRKSRNPLKIVAGLALQTVASSIAAKNSDKIKSTGQKLFFALLSKFQHNKNGDN